MYFRLVYVRDRDRVRVSVSIGGRVRFFFWFFFWGGVHLGLGLVRVGVKFWLGPDTRLDPYSVSRNPKKLKRDTII